MNPRLLRLAGPAVAAVIALGATTAALVIAQALILSKALAAAFTGDTTGLPRALALLTLVVAGRAAVALASETAAHRASAAVKSALRTRIVTHALRLGPAWLTGQRTTDLTSLATRGVDALDGYFAKYLPQLFLAVLVPAAVLAVLAPADWASAAIIVVTLPLIPIFMALVGMATAAHTRRRWLALHRLSHHFLDVVTGLPTLKVFGRAKAQAAQIAKITDNYRTATLATLRLAFLSSLVLELLATLSVALVAVGIGLRLVDGHLTLATALLVLLLAPEAYLPLRAVGTHYHASADGLEAAKTAFEVLDTPLPPTGTLPAPPPRLAVTDLTVHHPDRPTPAPTGLTFTLNPGEYVAVTGPSGTGKTTLLNTLLGFTPTDAVTVDGTALSDLDPRAWRRTIGWVPQEPHLAPGTVADLVDTTAHPYLDDLDPTQPIGEHGTGLSAGQRRRLALARALDRDPALLLLDEPTAGVDPDRENLITGVLRAHAARGAAVLVATHRPAVIAAADRVITLTEPETADDREPAEPGPRTRLTVDTFRTAPQVSAHLTDQGGPARTPRAEDATTASCPVGAPRPATSTDTSTGTSGEAPAGTPRKVLGRRLALAWGTGTLAATCAVGLTATAAWLISRAAQHPPVLYLMVAVVAVRAFGIGRGVLRYTERLTGHDAALRILAKLRVTTWNRLERSGADLTRRSGDLATRFVDDIDTLADRWLRVALPYATAATVGAAGITLSTLLLPTTGLPLTLSLLTVAVAAPWLAGRHARRAEARLAPLHGHLATHVHTTLTTAAELTAHDRTDRALADHAAADARLTTAERRAATGRGTALALTAAAAGGAVLAALALAAPNPGVDRVHLAVLVLLPLALHELFATLVPAAATWPRIRAAQDRVATLDPGAARPATATPSGRHDLRVEGLTARGRALPDIDIPAGTAHVLTGPSGSGKSTLAAVTTRFCDPTAGRVLLGGVDIATLDPDTLRRTIGLCAQDAHLFDSTIAANLRLARPDATDDDLHTALAAARLDDWVRTLPEGLHTHVGEHGTHLSGGQRQRLTLARALLADFPVLVFDEPTEHLDPATAAALQHDLLAATTGRTVLLITHQPPPAGIPVTTTITHHELAHA
ncbi:thiol reductant ABC exporter subunit CydD [Longispora sp. NPDC051575]|uniref:thiol reductant ABC exporter subunit CydD n=1 Tax=Longispora sp. NPDC051575 TaxID=3154943 RepID=UPI00341CFE50